MKINAKQESLVFYKLLATVRSSNARNAIRSVDFVWYGLCQGHLSLITSEAIHHVSGGRSSNAHESCVALGPRLFSAELISGVDKPKSI